MSKKTIERTMLTTPISKEESQPIKEENFYMEYDEANAEFVVYEIATRHANGNPSVSHGAARCFEEGNAIQIVKALNAQQRVASLEEEVKSSRELIDKALNDGFAAGKSHQTFQSFKEEWHEINR